MRVIGIDPGVATTGIGYVDAQDFNAVREADWLTITTQPRTPLPLRLREISEDLSEYLEDTQPELAVVEKIFFTKNDKTAINVAQARGVVLLTLADFGIPFIEPTPSELKAALTGDGRADKRQIQDMLKVLLKLDEIPKPDDAADALGLALFGALQSKNYASIT